MTETGRLTCAQLRDCAAELALGILPGRERAGAVEHLQRCPACRDHVRELAPMADGLIDLVPAVEPPLGFESRVLRRIGVPPRPHRRRRFARAVSAAAAAAALVLGGWAIGNASARTAPTMLRSAAVTAQGQHVGKAFAYTGASPWLYMAVDAERIGAEGNTVRCQVLRADGSVSTVGAFRLDDGYAAWGGPYPDGRSPVTAMRLLGTDGSVLATSNFAAAGR